MKRGVVAVAVLAVGLAVGLAGGAAWARGDGRRLELDPARLGTPTVTPPIDLELTGKPSAVGMQCDGTASASSTHEPLIEWRLTADAPDLRVTITGARAAIHDDYGTWWCSDSHGDVDLARAHAGDYALYVFGDLDRATVTLTFESPTRVAQNVAVARDRAPVVHVGATTQPNPQLLDLTASRAGQARDLHLCVGDRESFTPLARVVVDDDVGQLRVAERAARTVGDHAARLALVGASGRCAAPGPVKAGTYVLWAELDLDHVPKAFPIELDDGSRAVAWPDAPLVDLAVNTGEPVVDDGKIEPPGPWPSRATTRCKPLATAPSFYLAVDAAQPIELRMVWRRRAQWFLVDGPGVSTCSADGGPVRFDARAARYAVWVGGTPGADFHLFVHRVGAVISPVTTFGVPPADLSLGERVVPNFYPYFTLGADEASAKVAAAALFASISDRLVVYVGAQPLALLAIDKQNAQVLTVRGQVERVPVRAIAIHRPAQVELTDDTDAVVVQHLGATTVATAAPLPQPVDDAVAASPAPARGRVAAANDPARLAAGAQPGEGDDAADERRPSRGVELEIGLTFPPESVARGAPRDTSSEGFGFDATAALDLGRGVHVGAELALVQWSNLPTASVDQASHVYRVDAFARYVLGRGRLRPYALLDVGAGLSSLANGFTIYDLRTPGTTTIADRNGLAFTCAAGVGFARSLRGPWSIVGELAARRTTLYHALSFSDTRTGATGSTDHLELDEIGARVALSYRF